MTDVQSTDLKFYYSGTGGPDALRIDNRGGALVSPLVDIANGVNYNLFPDVSRVQMTWVQDGLYWYQYICFIIANLNDVNTMKNVSISLETQTVPTDTLIGIGKSALNTQPVTIVNVNTAPTGITFTEKVGSVLPTLALSDMLPRDYYAIWMRVRQPHGKPFFKFAKAKFRVEWEIAPPPPPPPPPWTVFQDYGGPVITPAKIWLSFPGGAWDTATNPSMNDMYAAVVAMCAGTYFGKLSQYRSIAKPAVDGNIWDDGNDVSSSFTQANIETILKNEIDDGVVPSPTDVTQTYVIFPDHTATNSSGIDVNNGYFSYGGNNIHYVYAESGGGTDACCERVSKGLINMISNPRKLVTPGIGKIAASSTCLADTGVCSDSNGVSNGVRCIAYYSESDAACLVP